MALTNRCVLCGGWNRYGWEKKTGNGFGFASVKCVDCAHEVVEPVTPFKVKYDDDNAAKGHSATLGPNDECRP